MNKTVIAIIAVLVLAALGFGVYSFTRNNPNDTNDNQNESDDSGSLANYFAQGADYSCTYSNSDSDSTVNQAEMYISNGGDQYYYEVDYSQNDEVLTSYMMKDGNTIYTWSSNGEKGFKQTLDAESETTYTPDSEDFDNKDATLEAAFGYEYDCDPWTVDENKFTPPSSVEFTDLDALVEETKNNACDMCDSLSGESKTQCLVSLECN